MPSEFGDGGPGQPSPAELAEALIVRLADLRHVGPDGESLTIAGPVVVETADWGDTEALNGFTGNPPRLRWTVPEHGMEAPLDRHLAGAVVAQPDLRAVHVGIHRRAESIVQGRDQRRPDPPHARRGEPRSTHG